MPNFEVFVLKLMTDTNFAGQFLPPNANAGTRKTALTNMGFSPAAITAAEDVFGAPGGAGTNIKTLIDNMTPAGGGGGTIVAANTNLRN